MASSTKVKTNTAFPENIAALAPPKERETLPEPYRSGYNYNGNMPPGPGNFVKRRWLEDFGSVITRSTLLFAAQNSPLTVLTYLPDIDPAVSFSIWQKLRLAIPEDGLPIIGMAPKTGDRPAEKNDEATTILQDLFENLPAEVGGLSGIQSTLFLVACLTGSSMVEAVPAKKTLGGVSRIWPVNPLTIEFSRPNSNSDLIPFQSQVGTPRGYKQLNPETFFWRALDNWVDDPHGRSPYKTALAESLVSMAFVQDLRDNVHTNAFPRKVVGFNFEKAYEIAKTVFGEYSIEKAKGWVQEWFSQVKTYLKEQNPDDDIIIDTNGDIKLLQGGSYQGIEHIISFFRQRQLWAMKDLPLLMGVNDATSETYASVQFTQYINGLEALRSLIMLPLIKTCNLHYRLLGKNYKAKADHKKLRVADILAQTQIIMNEISNAANMRDQGFISQEEASIMVTGTGAVSDPHPAIVAGGKGQTMETGNVSNVTAEEQRGMQQLQRSANKNSEKAAEKT